MGNLDPKDWIKLGKRSRGVRLERTSLGEHTQIYNLHGDQTMYLAFITVGKDWVKVLNSQDEWDIEVKVGRRTIVLKPGVNQTFTKKEIGKSFKIVLNPEKVAGIILAK